MVTHDLQLVLVEEWLEILVAQPAAQHQFTASLGAGRFGVFFDMPGPEITDPKIRR